MTKQQSNKRHQKPEVDITADVTTVSVHAITRCMQSAGDIGCLYKSTASK